MTYITVYQELLHLLKWINYFKKWIERYMNNGEVRKNSKFIKDCTYIRTYNQIKLCEGYKIYVSNDNPGGWIIRIFFYYYISH